MIALLALALLLGAVALAYMADSWRYVLAGMMAQYLAMSLLLMREAPPLFGLLRLGVGIAVALILYFTIRQFQYATRRGASVQRVLRASRYHPYRLATLALTAVIAFGLATANPFPDYTVEGSLAAYFLGGSALLMLLVGQQMLRDGISLLFLDSAIQFLGMATVSEGTFLTLIFGSLVTPLLALAVAFLMTLQREVPSPEGPNQ